VQCRQDKLACTLVARRTLPVAGVGTDGASRFLPKMPAHAP
jgi:hypothetical protein